MSKHQKDILNIFNQKNIYFIKFSQMIKDWRNNDFGCY